MAEYSAFAVFAVANELARGTRGGATAPPHHKLLSSTDNLFYPYPLRLSYLLEYLYIANALKIKKDRPFSICKYFLFSSLQSPPQMLF